MLNSFTNKMTIGNEITVLKIKIIKISENRLTISVDINNVAMSDIKIIYNFLEYYYII